MLFRSRISFHPFLLPLEIFSKPSCSFQTWTVSILPPHHRFKGSLKGNVLLRCGRKRAPSDSITFLSLFLFLCLHYLCVFAFKFWVSLVFYFALFNMFLIVFSFVYFVFNKKKLKNQKNTKTMYVLCKLVLVYLEWPLKQSL